MTENSGVIRVITQCRGEGCHARVIAPITEQRPLQRVYEA